MKTKIIPFDLEMAKKIQTGEIEGKIVCRTGHPARILCTDFKDEDEVFTVAVAIEENCLQEKLVRVRTDGTYSAYESDMDLFIELPEEASKQKGELTLGKCKEGDEVWIFNNYDYGPEYVKVKVGKLSIDRSSGHRRNITFENGFTCQELVCQTCWYENPNEQKMKTKEFKPFDKVLVREQSTDEWKCDYFSHAQNDGVCTYYVCIGGEFLKCVPYEGNEHLVGTINKPE